MPAMAAIFAPLFSCTSFSECNDDRMSVRQINPLGLLVGGPGHEPSMVVARGSDGKDRWIDEVARGMACNCACLECGSPVIARQGDVREWSFAHKADSNCSGGVETQAHRFAKSVINEAGGLYVASAKPDEWGLLHPRFIDIAPVRIEERIAGFRADLIGSMGARDLVIEVKVTHGCPPDKVTAYRALNLSVLEIDLGPFRYKTANELRQAVIQRAPRFWLCLSDGREVPRQRETARTGMSGGASRFGGLTRPGHVPRRAWTEMSALEKVQAVDPDGRLTIKSRGYRG
jgi:Competence protein CoiA-like family